MCFGGGAPSVPKAAPRPEKADYVGAAQSRDRSRAASAVGRRDTVLTGALGLQTDPNLRKKTLLGG